MDFKANNRGGWEAQTTRTFTSHAQVYEFTRGANDPVLNGKIPTFGANDWRVTLFNYQKQFIYFANSVPVPNRDSVNNQALIKRTVELRKRLEKVGTELLVR